jgi:uncharacterized membrane protein YhhN
VKKIALTLFGVVSTAVLVSTVVEAPVLHFICKPLIMITLGGYYISSTDGENRNFSVLVAIFFSCVGDILLMFVDRNELYFMLGLGAFLIAHVFYIFAYRQHKDASHPDELQGVHRIRLAFPVILAGSGLVVILYPTLGALKIPVLLYAITIVIMVLNALFRFGRTQSASFWMVFIGAVFFMISDSLIAINRFVTPISSAHLLIMITYIAAQVLIVEGLLRHKFSNA